MDSQVTTRGQVNESAVPNHRAIHTVAFEVIERCNLSCGFCIRAAEHGLPGMVEVERFRTRVENVSDAFPELTLIAITGGEPFLHPQLPDLVAIASQAGTQVSITTNGTILRRDDLERYARYEQLHLILSIDGPTAAVHDVMRGRAGSFDRVMGFARACRQVGIRFLVNMTVGATNYQYVYGTALLARDIGAIDIAVALIKPTGRGEPIADGQVVLAEAGRQAMLAKRDLSSSLVVRFLDPLAHVVEEPVTQPRIGGCGMTSGALHVQCDGNVLMCTACTASMGNIDEIGRALSGKIQADARLAAIASRSALGGTCGSCRWRDVCGGCRCRAAASGAGILGPDPLCPKHVSARHAKEAAPDLQRACEDLALRKAQSAAAMAAYPETLELRESSALWKDTSDVAGQEAPLLHGWLQSGLIRGGLGGKTILGLGFSSPAEPLLLAALGARVDVLQGEASNQQPLVCLADAYGLPVRVLNARIGELENATSTCYDFVYLSGSFSYPEICEALCIAYDLLVLEGRVLIAVSTETDGELGPTPRKLARRRPTRLELLNVLATVGFRKVRIVDLQEGWFCVLGQRRGRRQDPAQ